MQNCRRRRTRVEPQPISGVTRDDPAGSRRDFVKHGSGNPQADPSLPVGVVGYGVMTIITSHSQDSANLQPDNCRGHEAEQFAPAIFFLV